VTAVAADQQARQQDWPLSLTQAGYAQRLRGYNEKPANVMLALDIGTTPADRVAQELARLGSAEPLLRSTLADGESGSLRIEDSHRAELGVTPELDRTALDEYLYRHSQYLFAAGEPLWRPQLIPITDGANVLALAFHHIIFDGVSRGVLLRSLAAQESAPQSRPPLYREFARRQQEAFESNAQHTSFWHGYLDGWAHNRHVDLGFARNLDQPLDDGCAQQTASLTGLPLWQALKWGRQHGASLFVQVLSALSVALGETSGDSENLVRATFHGRPPGFEDTLGCFGHDVVVRLPTESVPLDRALATTSAAWDGLGDPRKGCTSS
jgi:hypothetical protein